MFFQQDVPGVIFVSSVVPGAAAARSGIVKKGDIVVKVAKSKLTWASEEGIPYTNLVFG